MATENHDSEIVPLDRNHFYEMIKTGYNEGLFGTEAREEDGKIILLLDPIDQENNYYYFNEIVISERDNTIMVRELNEELVREDRYIYNLVTCEITFMPEVTENDIVFMWIPCQLEVMHKEDTHVYALVLPERNDSPTRTCTLFNGVCTNKQIDTYCTVILSKEFSDSLPPK